MNIIIDDAGKQMSKIIAFLDKQGIEWSPVHLEGKEPRLPSNRNMKYGQHMFFKMLEEPNQKRLKSLKQMSNWKAIAMDTRTIAMLDVDYYNKEEKLSTDMSSITDKHPWHKSITKRNPKIWVKLDCIPEKARYDTKWPGVELLCSQWSYAFSDADVFNPDMPILEMSLSDIIAENKNKPLKQMCQSPATEPIVNELKGDTRVLDLIDGNKVSEYHDWLAVLAAMYHSGYSLSDAHDVSSRASNYDSDAVDAKWAEASKLSGYTFGTICHYAKESDPEGYKELLSVRRGEATTKCMIKFAKKVEKAEKPEKVEEEPDLDEIEQVLYDETKSFTNLIVGKIFHIFHRHEYSYCKGKWFRINKYGIYEKLDDDSETILMQKCITTTHQFIGKQITKNANNSDRIKLLTEGLKISQNNQFMKNTISMLRLLFLDETLYSKLDKNLKLIGFKNGVFDLKHFRFRKATREDYVSITTGYDYSEECNNEYFDKLIESIFENKERAEWFKVFIGSLIVGGNPEEKCYFLVGAGRNGKGTIDSLIRYALGAYYGDVPSSYYTTPDVAGRASPEVMAFKNVRVAMTQEPASGEQAKYHTDKVKRGSGNDPLTGRYLYGNLETFQPHHKPLCCTNYLPTFTDIDDGLKARLVVVLFPLQFMDSANYDPSMPSHRKQNSGLKVELEQYRHMFFNYMLEQYKKYASDGMPALPKCMLEDLREYQDEVDSVKTFMKSSLKQVEGEYVSLSDLHTAFKQHEDMAINTFSSRLKKLGYKTGRRKIYEKTTLCVLNYQWQY
jgi:P4 family phage/plasmid primase-like protien